MKTNEIKLLDDNELAMLLYILNVLKPVELAEKFEFDDKSLTWLPKDVIVRKILESFDSVKPEFHPIYSSILTKFGVEHTINKNEPPPMEDKKKEQKEEEVPPKPEEQKTEITGSAESNSGGEKKEETK